MRVGILGGTYDPIHLGHLLLAEQARDALSLEEVLLVPAGRPPHKPDRVLTPYALRLRMIELAVTGATGLIPSDIERNPERPSFTLDTLRRLKAERPDVTHLWLLLGDDSLADLPTWRDPEEIVRLARLAVYPRPGDQGVIGRATGGGPPKVSDEFVRDGSVSDETTHDGSVSDAFKRDGSVSDGFGRERVLSNGVAAEDIWRDRIDHVDGPRLLLSSTDIRERVRQGRSIRFLVPEPVRELIEKEGLFRS